MPNIQGSHTVQILPRQREVSIQDNWEVDKYIVLGNGQVSPSSLSLSVSHSGFTNPLYEWKKYNPKNGKWESINKTSKTISIAPQEEWGNDGFKIGCLVKERDKNGDEGVFAYKPFTRRYLDSVSDDTSSGVDSNIWSKFISGELSELNIVCSNPNGFTFPEDVGNRLTAGRVSILMHIGWGQNWHPSTWFTNNEIKNADMRVLIPKYVRVFTSDGIEIEGTSVQGNSTHYSYKAKPAWGNGEKGEANSATYEFLFISDGLRRKSYCIWLNRIETRGLEVQERAISDLKKDPEFINKVSAAPIRPNLLRGFMGIEKKTLSAINTNYTHTKLGINKFLEAGKMYAISADVEMLEGSANAITLMLWSGSSVITDGKTAINGTKTRASFVFSVPAGLNLEVADILGYAGERGKTIGNLARYYNIKLEEVQEGEPKEASAYLPHTDDLKVPLSSVIQDLKAQGISNEVKELLKDDNNFVKATKGEKGESVTLADLNIGWNGTSLTIGGKTSENLKGEPGVSPSALSVANEINTASFRKGLANTVVTDVTTDPSNLNKIRRGMVVETKYNEDRGKIIKRVEDVEKEIVPFAFVEVGTYSSDWKDYTDNEYVGGGHKPDPWGGGSIDGYMRTVHNYELYRSMQNLPPKYIEQSKKVLKTEEYKVDEKWHRDVSATIVYDAQEMQGIDKGSARCWEIFTSPHVNSLLRYGKNTRMANPNMQGQQKGSGANAYWNVYLEKNTNYRIFVSNDGSGKYRLYVIKNGAY